MRYAWSVTALAAIVTALPATAKAADWSAELGLVSDYRYRGVSLSGEKPALQGSADIEWASGFYGELWASTIRNDGAGRIELDGTAGYALDLTEALSLDLSATYYLYPGHSASNALELSAAIEGTRGPLTGGLGASIAPPQKGTLDEDGERRANVYAFANVTYAIAGTPLSVRAGLGREEGPWDMRPQGSKWDYAFGLEAELKNANISLDLIGSNAGSDGLVGAVALRF